MDNTLRNWALTIGSALVASTIATGHGHLVASAFTAAGDVVLWLIQPVGPRG